ncbi:hypothetical protein SpCBS45565_g05924 [Spizellomyces sp. 'palustris']|nr:hypothetical protein SpCBS45565_g05924 [Spizellomyces sp. 'palustris']
MSSSFNVKKRKPEENDLGAESGKQSKIKKRVRIGDADIVGTASGEYAEFDDSEDLETAKIRRGAVKLDGYGSESESEDDDDGLVGANGGDDDMFGDSFPAGEDAKKKKGEVNYMRSEQIEGQEWVADRDDYNESGIKITPFNMEEEMEEGNFDEAGHYIQKKDEHRMHDRWLQGVTKEEIEKAKAAHDRQQDRMKALKDEEDNEMDNPDRIWLKVLSLMQPGESIPRALRRLAGNKPKVPRNKWKKNKKSTDEATTPVEEDPQAEERKKDLDHLTTYANQLLTVGALDAYDLMYEQIVRKLRSADLLTDDWQPGDPL